MKKTLIDLPFEAGVYTEQTARGAGPYWKDSDKVRFRKGLPEKLGGWKSVAGTFKGLTRKFLDWASLDGQIWVALATDSKLYLWQNDTLYDITPLRSSGTLTNPFDTTSGETEVTVTDSSHGCQRGDYVRFDGATAVGGITIDGEYQVKRVLTIDTYVIEHTSAASSTANGGGTVAFEYDISVGRSSTGYGTGYGTGSYSQSTYNTPREVTATVLSARTWALENWGEDLIANAKGGAIYWWDKSTGPSARATALTGSPERANFVLMNDRSRQLLALGATDAITGVFDPLLVRWCSSEDFNDWEVTDANTAGDARVYQGSKFVSAVRTRSEIIAFTDKSLHSIQQIGAGEFAVNLVGPNIAILGPNAAIAVANRVYFMAEGDFYLYDGIPRPMACSVRNYVFDNLNVFQKEKVHLGINTLFTEIWFFYPAKDPSVWFETSFKSGLFDTVWGEQSRASGAAAYDFTFDPVENGIWLTTAMNVSSYTAIWLLQSDENMEDPLEHDVEIVFSPKSTASLRYGLAMNVTDLNGTVGNANDDIDGIIVTVNPNNSYLYVQKRVSGVSTSFTNGAAQYVLGNLGTPVTLTAGEEYALRASRKDGVITVRIYNGTIWQTVATITMTSGEISAITGSLVGVIGQNPGGATGDAEQVVFRSIRVAEAGGILTADGAGANDEVNRYAIYNYLEDTWAIGSLARTAWADTSKAFDKPYAAGLDGVFYTHEDGVDDDSAAMESYIESFDSEIPDAGEYTMQVDRLIPDFKRLRGDLTVTMSGKNYSQQDAYVTDGPHTIDKTTTIVPVRIRGRQVSVRIESDGVGDYWRYGTMRARIFPHGKRGNG